MAIRVAPSSLRVGCHNVRVRQQSADQMNKYQADGTFDANTVTIEVRNDQMRTMAQDTLLHESLHAVLYCHGLAKLLDLDTEAEEKLIIGLAPALLSLLRDNPKLVAYLTDKE